MVLEEYRTAQTMSDRYRSRLLPNAQRAYEIMYQKYGYMQGSYPQVLAAEQRLYQLELDYVGTLEKLQTSAIVLQNFLLTDGLEAPSRPSDMDRPLREINAPSLYGMGADR